jgi:hypothetical protein
MGTILIQGGVPVLDYAITDAQAARIGADTRSSDDWRSLRAIRSTAQDRTEGKEITASQIRRSRDAREHPARSNHPAGHVRLSLQCAFL